MTDLERRVLSVARETFKVSELSLSARIGDPYQWDSLAHLLFMTEISKNFNVQVPPGKIANLSSLAKVISFIAEEQTLGRD